MLVVLSSPVIAQQPGPEIPFQSSAGPLKLPPDLYFGEATGVAVNSKGHPMTFVCLFRISSKLGYNPPDLSGI
jgi:hypothetical protein